MELVFFDLETSGFGRDTDVLQIVMSSERWVLNEYIEPYHQISPYASRVNKLTICNGELYYNNTEKLSTLPQRCVLHYVLDFLQALDYPCVLVAHNCPFDSSHLMRIIRAEGLEDKFRPFIAGFTDTLAMLRQKFPERKYKGQMKLTTLAEELGECTEGAHDAGIDVNLLKAVALYHFTEQQLVDNRKSFDDVLQWQIDTERTAIIKETLAPLRSCISKPMISKIAAAGIFYDDLIDEYRNEGPGGVIEILERRVNGIPQVIKSKKVVGSILNHLDSLDLYDF